MSDTNLQIHSSNASNAQSRPTMSRRERILLALCIIPAALMCFWPFENPIARAPVFYASALILFLVFRGKQKIRPIAALYAVGAAALMLLYAMHGNAFLRAVNLFAIPLSIVAFAAESLASPTSVFPRCVCSAIGATARNLLKPLRALISRRAGRAIFDAVLSLIVCTPAFFIVTGLLIDADMYFGDAVAEFAMKFCAISPDNPIVKLLLTLLLSLLLFSALNALAHNPSQCASAAKKPAISAAVCAAPIILLDCIYALFVNVQFAHLFGGTETAMAEGYAAYARAGFFQLVAISAFNLMLFAVARWFSHSAWVSIPCALMLAATGVILVSAGWRMRLYVLAYGLTVLRVLTFWVMLVLAATLVICMLTLCLHRFPALKSLMLIVFILWIGLNAVDIDAFIARHNIENHRAGHLEEFDAEYLYSLSDGAQRVLNEYFPDGYAAADEGGEPACEIIHSLFGRSQQSQ